MHNKHSISSDKAVEVRVHKRQQPPVVCGNIYIGSHTSGGVLYVEFEQQVVVRW